MVGGVAQIAEKLPLPDGVALEATSWCGDYYLELLHRPSGERKSVSFPLGYYNVELLWAAVEPAVTAWLSEVAA